jgi:hypothetical protein
MKPALAHFRTLPLQDAALALNWARLIGSRLGLLADDERRMPNRVFLTSKSERHPSHVASALCGQLSDSTRSPVWLWFWGKNNALD